ncbi:MAG: DUF4867 family protein [Eubacteriales bacterium]|nr:DUF4867 family protein [Eubacteriales bacterium]
MKKLKAEKLTLEAFAPFGEFFSFSEPTGYSLNGALHRFYPDRILSNVTGNMGMSPIHVKKPEKYLVTQQEYHTTTAEVIFPFNDDMLLHVAPRTAGVVANEYAKAFIVPKNTMVKLYAGVWHLAPLPVHEQELQAVIILPECTYANDCTVVDLPEDQQFEIVL